MTETKPFTYVTPQLMGDPEHGYMPQLRSYLKTFGLTPGDTWSPFDYLDWVTDRQAEYNEQVRKAGEHPRDFWGGFDKWLLDQAGGTTYVVYQPEQEHFNIPLSGWRKLGLVPTDYRYKPVWSGKVESPDADADGVMKAFTRSLSRSYRGRKFQVGDVIVIGQEKSRKAWFYDTDGFVRIRSFETMRWMRNQTWNKKEERRHEKNR